MYRICESLKVILILNELEIICLGTINWFRVSLSNTNNSIQQFIHLHIVKWFQKLPCNINNSIKHQSFVCTQLNGFRYSKWLNRFIWPRDGGLTSKTTLGPSGCGSNEGTLYVLQSYQMQFNVIYRTRVGRSYPSTKTQSAYSTASADWAVYR